MKVLLAGAWEFPIYEEGCAIALRAAGVEVIRHSWSQCFRGIPGKAERKWTLPGPGTFRLNRDLLKAVQTHRPDIVLIWRGTHVFPSTLRRLRTMKVLIAGYNNDDSFSPRYHESHQLYERRMWKHFNAGLPYYDLQLAFRPVNVQEYRDAGCDRVYLLPPWYRDDVDRKLELSDEDRERFQSDVTFIGHHEPDREAMLLNLVREGVSVRLRGDVTWRKTGAEGRMWEHFGEIAPVYGEDYVKSLNGASISLAFLSKRHRDPWTRRCFEIPACGSMMLSERTEELQGLFREGVEADYFSTQEELQEKVLHYLAHPDLRKQIAEAGHERVRKDGHGVHARMLGLKEELQAALSEFQQKPK